MSRDVGRRCEGEAGNALVEFTLLGFLLLVPIVYLAIALGRVEAGLLAVQRAAREAGRVYVTAPDDARGRSRADAAAALALTDQGFASATQEQRAGLELDCGRVDCLQPEVHVRTTARLAVVLPGVPRLLDRVIPLRVEVDATQVTVVERFRAGDRGPAAVTVGGRR